MFCALKKTIGVILIGVGLGDFEGESCITEEDDIYNYHMNKTIRNIEPVVDLCNRINDLIDVKLFKISLILI